MALASLRDCSSGICMLDVWRSILACKDLHKWGHCSVSTPCPKGGRECSLLSHLPHLSRWPLGSLTHHPRTLSFSEQPSPTFIQSSHSTLLSSGCWFPIIFLFLFCYLFFFPTVDSNSRGTETLSTILGKVSLSIGYRRSKLALMLTPLSACAAPF